MQERSKLNKFFVPKSRLGKKTLTLFASFWIFFSLFWIFVKLGYRGGDTYWSQPVLSVPMTIAGICGVTAFFTGLTSVIKHKERSLLVFLAILWGGFVLLFISGEVLSPH